MCEEELFRKTAQRLSEIHNHDRCRTSQIATMDFQSVGLLPRPGVTPMGMSERSTESIRCLRIPVTPFHIFLHI